MSPSGCTPTDTMHSVIQICNAALLLIGTRAIASLEEPTPEAAYCKRFYDQAVLSVLRDHPWGFAQRREKLAEVRVPEGWQSAYRKAYAYPIDCVQSHYLITACGMEKSQAYELAADDERTILLTNLAEAVMAYTAHIRDVTRFDPMFVEVLTRKLQCLLTRPIMKGSQGVREAEELYSRALSAAKTADAKEGLPFNDPEEAWLKDNPWAASRMALFRRP